MLCGGPILTQEHVDLAEFFETGGDLQSARPDASRKDLLRCTEVLGGGAKLLGSAEGARY